MNILFICKKHWEIIKEGMEAKEIKNTDFVGGIMGGIGFRVEIIPYLKKPRMLNADKFKYSWQSNKPFSVKPTMLWYGKKSEIPKGYKATSRIEAKHTNALFPHIHNGVVYKPSKVGWPPDHNST